MPKPIMKSRAFTLPTPRQKNTDMVAASNGTPVGQVTLAERLDQLGYSERLKQLMKQLSQGTDLIRIGSGAVPEAEVRAGDMSMVAEIVQGVRFLVKGWIPYGMLSMVMGPPGVGKSGFALGGLAAPILVGGSRWFNGLKAPKKPGYVLWCDTEGTAAITVQRIKDWKLPPKMIKTPWADDPLRSVDLSMQGHLDQIEDVINKYKTKMAVVDSLRGSHKGDENCSRIANVLDALAKIAERTQAAIVIIHHMRKLFEGQEVTPDASRGSNAIIAGVRAQLAIYRLNHDDEWARLEMMKENLGLRPDPIGVRITKTGIVFGDVPEKKKRETQMGRAEDWLRQNMKPGKWYWAKELLADADECGFSGNAIQRAREDLGIVQPDYLKKEDKRWKWMLPGKVRN